MEHQVSIGELKRDLSGIINRAAYGGERIVIVSRGKPKAAMISIEDLHLLQGMSGEEAQRITRIAALEVARAIRSEIAAGAEGPLPDSAEELRELRETRVDELTGLR